MSVTVERPLAVIQVWRYAGLQTAIPLLIVVCARLTHGLGRLERMLFRFTFLVALVRFVGHAFRVPHGGSPNPARVRPR